MYSVVILLSCLALSNSHAVLPLIAPAVHSVHLPLVPPHHGYGYHGYGLSQGHGYLGQGFVKPIAHHIWKRSPHIVAPYSHGHVAHVAPVAHLAPVAVSHQSRVDVRSSPLLAPVLPVVKPVVAPVIPAPTIAPYHAAGLLGFGGYGHYATGYGHHRYPYFGHR